MDDRENPQDDPIVMKMRLRRLGLYIDKTANLNGVAWLYGLSKSMEPLKPTKPGVATRKIEAAVRPYNRLRRQEVS